MTTSKECIWVIAPSFRSFQYWCREHDILPGTGRARYVRDANDLRGRQNLRLAFADHWQDRPDWRDIWNAAERAGRRPE